MLSLHKNDFEPGGGRDPPSVKSRSTLRPNLPLPELELWIQPHGLLAGARLPPEPLQPPKPCQLPVPGLGVGARGGLRSQGFSIAHCSLSGAPALGGRAHVCGAAGSQLSCTPPPPPAPGEAR